MKFVDDVISWFKGRKMTFNIENRLGESVSVEATSHDAARLMADLDGYEHLDDEEDDEPKLRAVRGGGQTSTKPQPKLRIVR